MPPIVLQFVYFLVGIFVVNFDLVLEFEEFFDNEDVLLLKLVNL